MVEKQEVSDDGEREQEVSDASDREDFGVWTAGD
jgi:hypothetical protein